MKFLTYTALLCLAALISACESEVPGDLGLHDYEGETVVNAAFSSDHTPRVFVSRSKGILEATPYTYIGDASVRIIQNGKSIALEHNTFGIYETDQSLLAGQPFKVEVTTASGTTTGEDIIPDPVVIKSLKHIDTIGVLGLGQTISKTTLVWDDAADEENHYELLMYQMTGDTIDFMPMNSTSLSIINGSSGEIFSNGDNYINRFLIADDLFNGKEFTLDVFTLSPRKGDTIYVSLKSLSPIYFDYLLNRQLAAESIGDPFAEPISAVTNITNGLGIVAGYSLDMDTIPGN